MIVLPVEWTLPQQIDRVNFNDYLRGQLSKIIKSKNDIESVIIHLPPVVSKLQRYNIHRLNWITDFKTESKDDNYGNRVMDVVLSKYYVEQLFGEYPFESEVEVPKTEKEILFDNFIKFIEGNFQTEFQNYLNKI